jgi:hypothetical protein
MAAVLLSMQTARVKPHAAYSRANKRLTGFCADVPCTATHNAPLCRSVADRFPALGKQSMTKSFLYLYNARSFSFQRQRPTIRFDFNVEQSNKTMDGE